jgi:voltage-gated potassium channel
MNKEKRISIFNKLDQMTEIPLLILSIIFIPILVTPFLFDLNDIAQVTLETLDRIIWAIFVLDLIVKIYFSENRVQYIKSHPFDVLVALLPFLRSLRVLRAMKGLKIVRVLATLGHIGTTIRRIARRKGIQLSLAFALIVFLVASIMLFIVEKDSNSQISDLGASLWWAIATLTNVGAGDITPATPFGKGIGVFLMISGIGVFTSLAANIAAVLLDQTDEMTEIKEELADIKKLLVSQNNSRNND